MKIYRHPDAPAGGAAPASGAPAAPAAPSSSGTSAPERSGAATFSSFREGLAKALSKDSKPSQPPQAGEKTEPAATGPEGEATDQVNTEEPVTTAKPEDETAPGEEQEGDKKKGWTEEDQKELKAHGLDKLAHSPESSRLLQSFREARAEKDRLATSNANVITRVTDLEAMLAAGDVKALQAAGYDLKVDQRTPDKMIEEIEADFNAVKGAFEPLYTQLIESGQDQTAAAVKRAFNSVAKKYNDRAAIITREKENQDLESRILEKAGVKPDTKNAYKKLADQAQNHLTAITQQDPEAGKYYKELEAATKAGGPLAALGLSLAKGYGTSLETAKIMNEIGKGLHFARNFKSILAGEQKKWEKDFEKKSLTRGSPGGSPRNGSDVPGLGSQLSRAMRVHMGKTA